MNVKVLENQLKVIKLKADAAIPNLVFEQNFYSITKTDEELSIVVNENVNIVGEHEEHGWRVIKIVGPLDFGLIGILAKISTILAQAKISIFALSTYDTDYILLKEENLNQAVDVLSEQGYKFV